MGEQSMDDPAMNVAMAKMQWLDESIGDDFKKDTITRSKLKELKRYNKLSLKTKLKRLNDEYKINLHHLQSKTLYDKHIIEKGGHPELGFENDYETHLTDDAYDGIKKGRARRLKRINNGR